MTVRAYFEKNLQTAAEGGIKPLAGRDDVLLFAGVPIDSAVYAMVKAGRFDDPIPEDSLRRFHELGATVEPRPRDFDAGGSGAANSLSDLR